MVFYGVLVTWVYSYKAHQDNQNWVAVVFCVVIWMGR
jgi:hypothetical protein